MTIARQTPGSPSEVEALVALARQEHGAGRLDAAEAAYRKILALRPDVAEVHNDLGILLAQQGKCAEAIPLLERALAADPREAKAGVLLARCQILGKDYAAAETTLSEALRRDPGQADAQLELAIARYHQENFAGARSALDAARPSLSGDARFQLYDGLVLLREGKRDEGIAEALVVGEVVGERRVRVCHRCSP